jgi:hypothetical protein
MNLLGHVNLKGQTRSLEVNQPAKMWEKKWVVKMDWPREDLIQGSSSGVIKRGWEIPELNFGLKFKAGTRWEHNLEMRWNEHKFTTVLPLLFRSN